MFHTCLFSRKFENYTILARDGKPVIKFVEKPLAGAGHRPGRFKKPARPGPVEKIWPVFLTVFIEAIFLQFLTQICDFRPNIFLIFRIFYQNFGRILKFSVRNSKFKLMSDSETAIFEIDLTIFKFRVEILSVNVLENR